MRLRVLAAVVVLLVGGTLVGALAGPAANAQHPILGHMSRMQKRILSGFLSYELDLSAQFTARTLRNYQPRGKAECPINRRSNIKVNQNCLNVTDPDLQGRAQAENEPAIAADPNQPDHLVASANDYVRGDGTCGSYWSSDGGRTWQDGTLPNGFVRGTQFAADREYFHACGDTSVAWDSKGNAYELAMMFLRGTAVTNNHDYSSGIYVFRSTGNHGASWNFPGRPVAEVADMTGAALLDKPYMTVDNWPSSRYQDRVYVTWSLFAADGTVYIYGAYSSDYGETFSGPVLVSSNSTLCGNTYGLPTPHGACNQNQFSQPFTGPDGVLYVVYNNYNNTLIGNDNRNQTLLVKSTDGGRTFGAPVKVADFYDLPDCLTYQGQNPGRACVPEKGPSKNSFFRAANYPSGAVNPRRPNQVAITLGSYINAHSNEHNGCTPAGLSPDLLDLYTGVKQPGACNNDILLSVSTDGGQSFTGTTTDPRELPSVTSSPRQATTDQWFQWAAFTRSGRLAVSYYDRQYGDDEVTGFSDFSLSGSDNLKTFGVQRVSSAAMPPPTQFDGMFWGDYTGLTAIHRAYPIWSDTRDPSVFMCQDASGKVTLPPSLCLASAPNARLANDQNIYTAGLGVPVR
ncbi:MAG TPA: sialidase family protein [Kofleriaceae bacterium]|jgi:hypothetical protein|nr:sialidase family protein [Kofleriaceae bacterium]